MYVNSIRLHAASLFHSVKIGSRQIKRVSKQIMKGSVADIKKRTGRFYIRIMHKMYFPCIDNISCDTMQLCVYAIVCLHSHVVYFAKFFNRNIVFLFVKRLKVVLVKKLVY